MTEAHVLNFPCLPTPHGQELGSGCLVLARDTAGPCDVALLDSEQYQAVI